MTKIDIQLLPLCLQVINHKDYKTRDAFDAVLHEALEAAGVEIICLAGFMRILTGTVILHV